ncbi:MAG: GNAT family protein [Planctomycetota bacterium]
MPVATPILQNEIVALEPAVAAHAAGLAACCADDPATFRYFSGRIVPGCEASMASHLASLAASETTRAYAVRSKRNGDIVGCTTYLDIRVPHLGVEIGWTFYGVAARGTAVNPACKLLLMDHAFGGGLFGVPAVRVQLKTDERNAHSRRAIEKLGAAFEGVMRQNVVMSDGFRRSTAMYSVLLDEWPDLREQLKRRLAEFSDPA